MDLEEIAFNNLKELIQLDKNKYFVIKNKNIFIKNTYDFEDIDNIYKFCDLEYPIYFTFTYLIRYFNKSNYFISGDYTKNNVKRIKRSFR